MNPNKTLKFLEKCNIDFANVDVFLSKANEYDEYKKKLEKYPVNFIISHNYFILFCLRILYRIIACL